MHRAAIAACLGAAALVASMPAPGRAAARPSTGPIVALTPLGAAGKGGYFIYGGKGGRMIHGSVAVRNMSRTASGIVRLYGVDATTGQTSGAVYRWGSEPRRDVGRWLSLSRRQVTLPARHQVVVAFTVRVPRGVRPGQHLGAIVAQPSLPVHRYRSGRNRSSFRIKVQSLTILAVQVNVPGPGAAAQRMAIGGCRVGGPHRYQTMFIDLSNTGNVLLKGSGTLTVAKSGERTTKHQRFSLDTFVPRTQIAYPVVLRGTPLHAGVYRTTVAVTYGSHHRMHRTMTCTVTDRSVKEVFGSVASASLGQHGGGGDGPSAWLLALGAVVVFVVGFGGAGLLFRTRLRGRSSS